MMKATVLLLVAFAVAANGLGFPNFNLGCPFSQANRFAGSDPNTGLPNTLGVIPYCRVVNGVFVNDLSNQLVSRTGYTPTYTAAPGYVIINPSVSLNQLLLDTSGTKAYPGTVVSLGPTSSLGATASLGVTANSLLPTDIMVGTLVGFQYLTTCSSLDNTRISGVSLGLGLTSNIVCPYQSVLGRFEFGNQAGGTLAGAAQALSLPRPYVFYGL